MFGKDAIAGIFDTMEMVPELMYLFIYGMLYMCWDHVTNNLSHFTG